MTTAVAQRGYGGLLLPALLLAGLLAVIGTEAGLVVPALVDKSLWPETLTVAPRPYAYRAPGDFIRLGAAADGPLIVVDDPAPLEIMKYQVSAADYARCVAEGACDKAEPQRAGEGNLPATGVSFDDATDYARWLSARTGETWRLPTIAEWTFAAGSKARDHALGIKTDANDPAERWLASYERDSALADDGPATLQPLGAFGENEFGVADLAGSVWEWTATCASRTTLGAGDAQVSYIESCGIRLLEGQHRTPMSAFIRDAQGGGCSVGAPPDNLGFRLVRERSWWQRLAAWFYRA